MGSDKDQFLKGRKSENQGMGKGAFTYYRNIVEKQKNNLLKELIKAANMLELPAADIKIFEDAKEEKQFKTVVDRIKHVIPESLLIKGHNPLILLHKALSQGMHPNLTDEQCLQYATHIRIILCELCEKMTAITKNDKGINAALSKLTGNGGTLPDETDECADINTT